jgi:hypothetical protein
MNGPIAQLVALCCHLNGRARGVGGRPFFPANSTSQFCEYIHFVRQVEQSFGKYAWKTVATTPDEWLLQEATPGKRAYIVHGRVNNPQISDRMSAGFVGGGGRWLLALTADRGDNLWEASWEVGNQEAVDQRIWRVRYGLVAEQAKLSMPNNRPVHVVCGQLQTALADIVAFADDHRIEGFAACFRKAIACLSDDNPFTEVYHKDLAPDGVLALPAQRLLAACQAAWVFGGMGSWNDMGFDGAEQKRYDRVSEKLFALLNEGICASANSSAGRGA